MKMLQRIVSAFASRPQVAREARVDIPETAELHRTQSNSGPGGEQQLRLEGDFSREVDMDPSVAARRLWCSAGHF
jgi:hypothetical protein